MNSHLIGVACIGSLDSVGRSKGIVNSTGVGSANNGVGLAGYFAALAAADGYSLNSGGAFCSELDRSSVLRRSSTGLGAVGSVVDVTLSSSERSGNALQTYSRRTERYRLQLTSGGSIQLEVLDLPSSGPACSRGVLETDLNLLAIVSREVNLT